MHPRPPKSAPGRLKSTKMSLKDIEEWVLQDSMLAQEKTRHSGHPPENITEERLLKTRLMEMGKERFKVLAKLNSEKQTFIDKQKRKTHMMKRSRDENRPVRNKVSNNSLGQRDGNSSEMPPLGVRRDLSNMIRPKTVQFQTNMHKGGYLATPSDIRPHTVALNPTDISTTLISTDAGQFMLDMSVPIPDAYNDYTMDFSRPSTAATGFSRSVSLLSSTDISFNRSSKDRRIASRPVGITSEPRYALLEAALSKNYGGHCKLDVRTIIDRSESLQGQTRIGGLEARKALQKKVKQFMLDKDFSFRYLLM